ncbi:MAG: REP-associated tyrosine transposase [Gammaproteobacteria bacterium]
MPRSRYRAGQESCPHFLTATVNHWLPLFTRQETVNIVLNSWRFLQREVVLVIYGYVILENHLHLVAKSKNLSRDIQRFKSFTAREIIAYLESGDSKRLLELLALFKRSHKTDSRYQVWEEGSHPQLIESEIMMRQKLDYIHQNPVKRGYVDQPEHWRYSSARNYAGQDGLIEVERVW